MPGRYTFQQWLKNKADFENILVAYDYIWEHSDPRKVRYWYDGHESSEYASLASFYLYGYRLVGTDFPDIDLEKLPPSDTELIVTTNKADAVQLTQSIFEKNGQTAIIKH